MKETDFIYKLLFKCQRITKQIKLQLENEEKNVWDKYNFRAKNSSVQNNTKCIPLYWIDYNWINITEYRTINIYRFIEFEKYFSFVENIKNIINFKYPNTILYQVAFTKLPNKMKISRHTDCTSKCAYPYRIHIVIKSNDNVIFFIDDKPYNFKEGEIVEINNMLYHSVENNSDEDRIHLLIDLIEPRYLKFGYNFIDITYKDIIDEENYYFGENGCIRPNCKISSID